jgi:hypothetical protein
VRAKPGRITALLSVAVLVVAACGSSSSSPSAGIAQTVEPTASPEPVVPTSEDLIGAALAAGSIGYDDSLVYRALALYDSPDLPAQFHSVVPDMHAAGDLLQEIRKNESKLSAATLEKLAPYRARPSDPISIFNARPAVARVAGAALAVAGPAALAAPTAPVWKSQTAAGGKARVWVKDSADAAAQLTAHAADVSRVWAAFPGIFTYPRADKAKDPSAAVNPDGAIDFYFVDATDIDPRRADCAKNPNGEGCVFGKGNAGYADRAPAYTGITSSGYLVIDEKGSGDSLVDTIAHELAHAAQFAYDWDDTSWLMESTATWVAYKVLKKLGGDAGDAYRWLPTHFATLDKPLNSEAHFHAYSSWLFFLYASMERGNEIVTDIWRAAGQDGVNGEKAVDAAFPFDEYFAGFALRDWNQSPVSPLYESVDDTFPGSYEPPVNNKVEAIAGGQEDSLNVKLPLLSAAYFDYSFEQSARAVTFENSLAGQPDAHVWAIAQIGDKWQAPQDWTGLDKKKFCRDAPEEDVTRLVLIVANSSVSDKLDAPQPPRIVGDAKGCVGWAGTMTGTYWWQDGGHSGTSTGTFTGTWVVDESIYAQDCEAPGCLRFIPEGTIDWTWDASGYIGQKKCQQSTSGSLAAVDQFGLGDQQYLYLSLTDDTHYRYWGQGNFYLSQAVEDSITCFGFIGDGPNRYPPPFFSIDEGASSSNSSGGGNTCYAGDWVIETKATTIAGSCYTFKTDRNYHQIEWNLTRLGPPPGS